MEKHYEKQEYLALLRGSADAAYFRTELKMILIAMVVSGAVLGLLAWSEGLWIIPLGVMALWMLPLLMHLFGLHKVYWNWARYEYLRGTVEQEVATWEHRRDCSALQVVARRLDGSKVVAKTGSVFRLKSPWMKGWPQITEYFNSEVLVAYDAKTDRAIILKRI